MTKQKIVFALVLAVAFLALTSGAEATYWIRGTVDNASDGTPADGHTAMVYLPGDKTKNATGLIGPEGASHVNNKYMCDAGAIPGYTPAVDDTLNVEVIDNDDGYTAGPVSVTISGLGLDDAPDMTLLPPLPPIVSDPQAIPPEIVVNIDFTELRVTVTKTYFDIDTVTVNLSPIGGVWNHTMNAMVNISENITIYNCTTNANEVGSFNLPVNATDTNGKSNTSVSIPLEVVNATQLNFTLIKKPGSTSRNWVSIPLNTDITNASVLMQVIGPNCTVVNRWNRTEQKADGWLGDMGLNFDIVAGEGYEVWVTANTTFSIFGTIASIGSVDLIKKPGSTGRNWVGLPYATTMPNASVLMHVIGPNCTVVNRWNRTEQKADGWLGDMGLNFDIVAGEGYEVWVSANTTWTPT